VLSQARAGGKEREAKHVQAVALMSSALHVCINARSARSTAVD
jgi:hypothetical protein